MNLNEISDASNFVPLYTVISAARIDWYNLAIGWTLLIVIRIAVIVYW